MSTPDTVTRRVLSPLGCFLAAAALLAAYSVARHLGWFGSQELLAAAGLTALLVLIARVAGLSADDLGLTRARLRGRRRHRRDRRPADHGGDHRRRRRSRRPPGLLEDERVDVSVAGLVSEIVVTILLVTVIPEELAFRGVLLSSGSKQWGQRRAVLASSVLFGLWHISPTLSTVSEDTQVSEVTLASSGALAAVTVSVVATFVAGLAFCWLRLRSRSLLAPAIAHFSINAAAFAAAWLLAR